MLLHFLLQTACVVRRECANADTHRDMCLRIARRFHTTFKKMKKIINLIESKKYQSNFLQLTWRDVDDDDDDDDDDDGRAENVEFGSEFILWKVNYARLESIMI